MATLITRSFVFTLLLFFAETSTWAGLPQEPREAPISLNVDLVPVLMDVSVLDRDKKFVADLEAEDFKMQLHTS